MAGRDPRDGKPGQWVGERPMELNRNVPLAQGGYAWGRALALLGGRNAPGSGEGGGLPGHALIPGRRGGTHPTGLARSHDPVHKRLGYLALMGSQGVSFTVGGAANGSFAN